MEENHRTLGFLLKSDMASCFKIFIHALSRNPEPEFENKDWLMSTKQEKDIQVYQSTSKFKNWCERGIIKKFKESQTEEAAKGRRETFGRRWKET